MNEQQTIEFNKRCAEFLGGVYDSDMTKYWFHLPVKWDGLFPPTTEDLKFHSDWNWIMEVVEAIQMLETKYTVSTDELLGLQLRTSKEAVVQAINQFLIWYNEQAK